MLKVRTTPDPRWVRTRFSLVLLLLFAPCVTGCGGCRQQGTAQNGSGAGEDEDKDQGKEKDKDKDKEKGKDKTKEKPKPDYDQPKLRVLPATADLFHGDAKPAHWFAARETEKANNFDAQVDLVGSVHVSRGDGLAPLELEHSPYYLTMTRPVALPKGQEKEAEAVYYVPRRLTGDTGSVTLLSRLTRRHGGAELNLTSQPIRLMPDYQYFFVVLARNIKSYQNLKNSTCFHLPGDNVFGQKSYEYCRLIFQPGAGEGVKGVPLPSQALAWTSIAALLWDDANPDLLSSDQQAALIDWLHWGGQLIVSGPNSLDALQAGFLAEYLPVLPGKSRSLDNERLSELSTTWSLPEKDRRQIDPLTLPKGQPLSGVELNLRPSGEYLRGTGNLVAERRVGRGRIVVTAFPLGSRTIQRWSGFDSFANGCLLRRPARRFVDRTEGPIQMEWVNAPVQGMDPRLFCLLRYFTRDAGGLSQPTVVSVAPAPVGGLSIEERRRRVAMGLSFDGSLAEDDNQNDLDEANRRAQDAANLASQSGETKDGRFGGFEVNWDKVQSRSGFAARTVPSGSGVAGWNDFSGPSSAARESLLSAAAITVPKGQFVLEVMGLYLLLLVPVNYTVFRLLGRVEWAWFAAPVMAVIGAVLVVRLAQLDIGFVRSRTEIAIMEMQGDYDRAHVTRYTALYSSLSTSYSFLFDTEAAVAQPFPSSETYQRLSHESLNNVLLDYEENVAVRGFRVASNSEGLVHSEQMLSAGGKLSLLGNERQGFALDNQTRFELQGAGILSRDAGGGLRAAWLGTVPAGKQMTFAYRTLRSPSELSFQQWEEALETRSTRSGELPKGEINLRRLIDLAGSRLHLFPGEARLIAWTADEPGGLSISPVSSQNKIRTLVLAHLRPAPLPPPAPDQNSYKMVAKPNPDLAPDTTPGSASPDES